MKGIFGFLAGMELNGEGRNVWQWALITLGQAIAIWIRPLSYIVCRSPDIYEYVIWQALGDCLSSRWLYESARF
jgi:hypothetical protein